MSRYDIAIIGMGCVFPRANDTRQYWKNVLSGETYFSKMPESLWHLDNYASKDRNRGDKSCTVIGSFIEGFEFPFLDYKLPPNAMKGVDPTQLVTLEATREALRDAGIEPRSAALENAITVIGVSGVDMFAHSTAHLKRHSFLEHLRPELARRGVAPERIAELEEQFTRELTARGHAWNPAVAAVGAIPSSVSNRVAQVFGVGGYNMTVDAACASSFVALDTACLALMAGDTRLAIAGGADLGTNPAIYIGFSRVDGLSIQGMSNPFDHTADGLVIGEGVGMVVLKRLEDAVADGDRIHAVIRGIGSSSDGAGQAIYAPSVEGRVEALRAALISAEVAADDVQYLEAHATSTIVGDANEYDAISTVYGQQRDNPEPLVLGSVKAQIGHLKAAAGMAGLIKTVLAMGEGTYPHMPRFRQLTPGATKPSPFLHVPDQVRPWKPLADGRRVAAVTTSGFGGVNYHAIVEQAPSYGTTVRPDVERDVAIVRVAMRVAAADNPEAFWDNVTAGRDTFWKVVPEELGWEHSFGDECPVNERITTRVVSRIEKYQVNLLRHKIFPTAVSQISPTQLLGLDLADRLLSDAGFELKEPKNIGVSVGSMHDDYFPTIFPPMLIDDYADTIRSCAVAAALARADLDAALAAAAELWRGEFPPVTEHTLPGWMTNVTAGRMANKLNLHGPNFTVDSACSSGLAALVPAIYLLMFRKVDLMVSGGLNQQLSDTFTSGVCALGAVAESVPRPFDAQGRGFLIGEGGILFLLKRLADARRDGDEILAVIHGVGGSSESETKSMVAPTEKAMRRSIRNTLGQLDRSPARIGVVDTHGSANLVSDLVEATSLAAELRPDGLDAPPVQITAIKSHIGHLYGGSGAASLLSAIQTLRTRRVPGIRNLEHPRPEIAALGGKVEPRHGTEPLHDSFDLGAANSLGLGGANYFAVVSCPEGRREAGQGGGGGDPGKVPAPVVRSGDAEAEDVFVCLVEREGDLGTALGRALGQSPVPAFLSEGDEPAVRLAVTFEDEAGLRKKLQAALKMIEGGHPLAPLESQGVFTARAPAGEGGRLAFCFPGQGTHYVGMGRFLYDAEPAFREVVDQVDARVKELFGFDLVAHIYGDPEDPEIARRLGTLVGAQTALFAAELGMFRVLESRGIRPDVMIGHSFGEISALAAAGVWEIDTALEAVAARIRAAEQIISSGGPPLGMASVICTDAQLDSILGLAGDKVVLTNVNAPGRFVISGERPAVERAVAVAESFGAEARLLPIGAAFHSRFMEPAREPFRAALAALPCRPPRVPVLSTITGEYVRTEGFDSDWLAGHLSRQLITKLDLPREIERLYGEGVSRFLEVGPGWSMTKMIDGILGARAHRAAPTLHPKVGDAETFRRARAFLIALGHLQSSAERRNLPGIFSDDFVAYMEEREPAVLALLREVHDRFRDQVRGTVVDRRRPAPSAKAAPRIAAPAPVPAPAAPPAGAAARRGAGAGIQVWIERLKEKLVVTTGYPPQMLEVQLDLEADLGVDSVQRAEIWVALTQEHGLDMEARPAGVRTIAQLAEALAALDGSSAPANTPAPAATDAAPPAGAAAGRGAGAGIQVWIERLKEKLVVTTGYPPQMLEVQLDLEADLGVDSVQRAEIWVALTQEHGLDMEARPAGVRTIAQLAEALAALDGSGTATPAPAAAVPAAVEGKGAGAGVQVWIERLKEKLVVTTGYPPEMLEVQLDLEADLGVDSVQRAEIWVALTQEHGLDMEARPAGVRTIAQLAEALAALDGSSAPANTPAPAATDAAPARAAEADACALFTTATRVIPAAELTPFECRRVLAITAGAKTLRAGLKKRLGARGIELTAVGDSVLADAGPEDARVLLEGCDTVLYLAHAATAEAGTDGASLARVLDEETARLYRVFRRLTPALEAEPRRVIVPVAGDGCFGTAGDGELRPLGSFPSGFVRCLAREWPACRFQLLDAGDLPWDEAVERVIDRASPRLELGIAPYGLVEPVVAPVGPPAEADPILGAGDLVLATGGARGITFECARTLARRTGCRLLLVGRTPPPEGKPSWLGAARTDIDGIIRDLEIGMVRSDGIPLGEAKRRGTRIRAQWEIARNLATLAGEGIDASYEVCDATDAAAFGALLDRLRGRIAGVIHGAGVQRSKRLGDLEDGAIALTVHTKLIPVLAMLDRLDWDRVRLLSAFGSIAGLFGNEGQTDYGLANDALAWLVRGIGRAHPGLRAQVVEWTAWEGTGMVTDEEAKRFRQTGLIPLDVSSGTAAYLDGLLGTALPQVACFNRRAALVSGRTTTDLSFAARPAARLLGGGQRARFDRGRDVWVPQHLVDGEPVVPGTFVTELFAEATRGEAGALHEVRFRRPLRVPADGVEVEIVRAGEDLLALPANRPALEGKALGNLAFSTARLGPAGGCAADGLELPKGAVERLRRAATAAGTPFYARLDAEFSRALSNGPVFRGVRSVLHEEGRFLALLTLTDEALAAVGGPELAFDPVLADMAVQAAAVWNMLAHDVFAIPFEIGCLHVREPARGREFVTILRGLEDGPEGAVADLAVRDPGGRLILGFDRLVLKTIAGRGGHG
jgi:acyl transferase domain-containing protein